MISEFKLDPDNFPQDLSSLMLPPGWVEDKWLYQVMFGRKPNGEIMEISFAELLAAYAEKMGFPLEYAGIELINDTNGRQVFFGLNPESVEPTEDQPKGNMFSGLVYHERAGGGSTLAVVAMRPGDFTPLITLIDQERALMGSGTRKRLQTGGGYPLQMAGTPAEIHLATAINEGRSEISGKLVITTENLINLYAPYNTNNGMVATAEGQGIGTQLLMIPFEALVKNEDGTYTLSRDQAEVADARLERIYGARFHELTPELRKELHQPADGCAACTKTYTIVDRVHMFLYDGIM